MAKRLLRREHIVAASLVGSVVVVVGFASGLGSRPGTGAEAAPLPGGGENPVATAPPTTTTTKPVQPTRAGSQPTRSGGGGGVIPVTTAPVLPPGTNHTGHPTTTTRPPATSTPPPTATTPPPTPCKPGLVPAAVTTLLGTLSRATDVLGLLGADPAAAATSLLPGGTLLLSDGTLLSALPDGTLLLPDGTPLDQFIATCPESTTTPTPTSGHG